MAKQVTVVRYAASDGSLHESAEAADAYDVHEKKRRILDDVSEIVKNETWGHLVLGSYCGCQAKYADDETAEYEIDGRNDAIAEIILAKWKEFKKVIEG